MMDKRLILDALQNGNVDLRGQFLRGSNGTFLVTVRGSDDQFQAVYKPKAGERPLWDFPVGTLGMREVATFLLDSALGWEFVPPTVYRTAAPLGPGSLQLFIDHDPDNHYFQLSSRFDGTLRKVPLFDFMLNNADRKAGHFLLDDKEHIWLIDHGLTFNTDDKLRTVAWEHAGEAIPAELLSDINRVHADLEAQGEFHQAIIPLLDPAEITALEERMSALLESATYPLPAADRRVFPWPPI